MLSTTFSEYFHVVFTVPEEIADIALQNKRTVYGILFRATAETLQTIAADPQHLGAQIGFFAVLHTWGQNLLHHPHLHCVVAGGGLSLDRTRWVSCRPGFFLPVRVLSRRFRRLFLKYLEKAFDSDRLQFFGSLEPLRNAQQFRSYIAPLKETEWVVYAKPPFAGPQQVLDYVGRYTHRVAISNNRLLDIEDDQVRFQWKDYRDNDRQKTMTLSAEEFIRRFLICPMDSNASATMAFLATVTGKKSLRFAVNCWECPLSIPKMLPTTGPATTITMSFTKG